MCPDWQNDVVGKPESDDSKTVRGVVQIASMFAKGVAESGVLSDESSLAVKALATIAQGQAEAGVHTNLKNRDKLGGILVYHSLTHAHTHAHHKIVSYNGVMIVQCLMD